jgi:GNAT superfamily N-acetyltransferase
MLGPEAAENDYTGVLPSHRNRGIAAVLKGQAIRWAQQNGVKWYYTASSVQNGPMIAVHHRLGYQAGPRRLEVVRDLKLEPDT